MAPRVIGPRSETAAHARLKRLAVIWAQAQGYAACAVEVTLPQCRYRADVAAYRATSDGAGVTAIFECKQAWPDLKRDNCRSDAERERLQVISKRREVLERNLRVHYPNLRTGDSLFPEWDSHDFTAIRHHCYTQEMRELGALSNRLYSGTKFEKLQRYKCANLLFLVLPNELLREPELPLGWGVLIEANESLSLARRPSWHESSPELRLRFLQRIASCATRHVNRELGIAYEEVDSARRRSGCDRPEEIEDVSVKCCRGAVST